MEPEGTSPDGVPVRRCPGCRHLVHDFRDVADAEVARVRSETPGPVCGVYTDRQLRRGGALPAAPPRSPGRWLAAWASALAALTLAGKADAQATPSVPTEAVPHDPASAPTRGVADSVSSVAGLVVDAETGEPLIGASVRVEGAQIGAAADIDGRFQIDLSAYDGGWPITLVASYVGYESETRTVAAPASSVRFALDLDDSAMDLAFYAYVPHRRPESVWLRIKRGVFW